MGSLPQSGYSSRRRFVQSTIAVPAALSLATATRRMASAAQATPETTLVLGIGQDPQNLDPHFTVEGTSYTIGFAVYETLVRNTIVDGQITGDLEPNLAESWTVSDDGLTWTFTLREGLTFSDGSVLDASAVKFSFDRLIAMNVGPKTSFFGPLASAEAPDPRTVRLTLSSPYAPFLAVLATYGGSIVNPAVISNAEGDDQAAAYLAANLQGSGPFVFTEWTRSQQIVLDANPNYWGPKPTLQRLIFRILPEASAARLALSQGDIDWTAQLTPDMLAEMEGQEGIAVLSQSIFAMTFGYLNNTRAPFDNAQVRQAFNYAIDRDVIIDNLLRGRAQPVRGPIPPGLLGHDDEVFQYTRDVDRARQLLTEAGMPDGFETTLIFSEVPGGDQVPQTVQANLAEVGIAVELQKIAEPTRRERIEARDFDTSIGGWTANFSDPHMFMGPLFDSNNWGLAGNRSFYKNERVDELVRQAAASVDPDERVGLYREAQDIIMEDAPYFFLFHPDYQLAIRDNLQGVALNPSNVFNVRFDLISKG